MTADDAIDAVRAERAPNEPGKVLYDEGSHPGIAQRLFGLGRSHREVAAAIGIEPAVLDTWLEVHEPMREAHKRSLRREADILESLEHHAVGMKDEETGRWSGGNPTLLKFLAECMGMRKPDPQQPREGEQRFDGMSEGQIQRAAQELRRKTEKVVPIRPEAQPGSSAGGSPAADGSPG